MSLNQGPKKAKDTEWTGTHQGHIQEHYAPVKGQLEGSSGGEWALSLFGTGQTTLRRIA